MSAIAAAPASFRLSPMLAAALIVTGMVLAACNKTEPQSAAEESAPASAAQTEVAGPPSQLPAAAVTQASWAPDTLEHLVAPIALYPDQLLGQILTASVNSQEVLDGGNWLLQNQSLKGDDLDTAAQKAGFGPAMRALVHFPTVVDMMCQQIDWTRQLGSAFTSDQKGVLDAVQRLRAQAAKVGNLKSSPEQKVETKTENDKTIIEVQPASPQVIYVPQYNPQVVYTTPPPPPPPAPAAPTSTAGTVSTGAAVAGGLLAFGVGVLVGNAMHSDDYCYPHWGAGAVYVGPRPFYPPAYAYHPAYGPAFRPANGYAPPPNYRYGYNNTNFNRNVNVNVNNNNNYFNQFNHNQNLRGQTQNNFSRATQNNLSGETRATGSNWKGQSTYAGAHNTANTAPTAQGQRFNQQAGRTGPSGSTSAGPRNQVGGAGGTRNPAVANTRNSTAGLPENRALSNDRAQSAGNSLDRGYGGSNRGGVNAGPSTNAGLGATRDAGDLSRPSQPPSTQSERAFSGASTPGSGGFERAASARGHASAGNFSRAGGRGRLGH
jgi:Protein of unknown function (DUF3300)